MGYVSLTGIEIKQTSEMTAEGWINDYESPLAASGHRVKLEKKHGKWVVVEFGFGLIS
ncbi:MAG: hypothetical protein ABSH20_19725 [Tepidisphaeraceae bacterium]